MLNLSNNSGPVFFYLHSVSCHQKYAHTIFHFLSCSRQFSSWFLHKSLMAGLTGVSGTWFSHRPGSPPWRKPMSTQKGERPQADLFKIFWLWAFPKKSTFPTEMPSFIENSFSFVLDATKCSAVFANTFVTILMVSPKPLWPEPPLWHSANHLPQTLSWRWFWEQKGIHCWVLLFNKSNKS